MSGGIEFGICPVCGEEKSLNRKYFKYKLDCVCCGGAAKDYHFEIAWHCYDCEPIEPTTIRPILLTCNIEKLEQL